MSRIITAVLADYRVKPLRDVIEESYAKCKDAGYDIEWAGYVPGEIGDENRTFMCRGEPIYFSAPKYDVMMDDLRIQKTREFRILMIEEGYSFETSNMSITPCIPNVSSVMEMMEEASKAALYGKTIGIPIKRITEKDIKKAGRYSCRAISAIDFFSQFLK